MASDKPIFLFGPYRLDTGKHALFNGATEIGLKPLTLDVLITLVENAPNLVTREALFEKHWKDTEVTENVLDQVIGTLRKYFRVQPDGDGYIQTIKKKGFRFSKAVERLEPDVDRAVKVETTPVEEPPSPGRAMVKDIRALLTKATASGTTRLASWREGEDLGDEVELSSSRGKERFTLRPDAFFSLEDTTRAVGRNQVHFFVLADRPADGQFEKNFLAFWEYQTSGKYTARYGVRSFRLLIFSATTESSAELAKLAHEKLPQVAQSHFLFAALPAISVNILGDVFTRPSDVGNDVRCSLVPARKNEQSANV